MLISTKFKHDINTRTFNQHFNKYELNAPVLSLVSGTGKNYHKTAASRDTGVLDTAVFPEVDPECTIIPECKQLVP